MPNYIFYDENGTIYKKVYSISSHLIDEGLIEGYQRTLKLDRNVIKSLTKFHKVDNGQVREMTQTEKDALLQTEADAKKQRLLNAIDKFEVSQLDIITTLIKRINVRIPNNPITKQEIIDQIKEDLGL